MNAFPPTLSNPVTMLPGAALSEGGSPGMEVSLLPGAARLLGLRFCSRSEAMLSLLHVRAILPERGPSAAVTSPFFAGCLFSFFRRFVEGISRVPLFSSVAAPPQSSRHGGASCSCTRF
mgnify:CR=1 FL=1